MLKIVIVYMGAYKHWALLSDRFFEGKPMLISNTRRNGTVREETWDQVVGDRKYKIFTITTGIPMHKILAKARNSIDRVRYDLIQYNCEHFVREMISGVAKSYQVRKALVVMGIFTSTLYLQSKKR